MSRGDVCGEQGPVSELHISLLQREVLTVKILSDKETVAGDTITNKCYLIYSSTALGDLGRFFSFLTHTQTIGHLARGISPSQGRYPHTDIQSSSGIRTHDPSVRAGEGGSCLRPRGHCTQLPVEPTIQNNSGL
jgi:hypothetical protein